MKVKHVLALTAVLAASQAFGAAPADTRTTPQTNPATTPARAGLSTALAIKPTTGPAPVSPAMVTSILVTTNTAASAPTTSAGSSAPLALTAGSATQLTVIGAGICKYRLSHVNLDAQGNTIMKSYPMVTMSSSAASPFPMGLSMLNNTPAGTYRWTASGVEGCTGSASVTFSVQ